MARPHHPEHPPPSLVTTTEALEAACQRLQREAYVTVDTEFMRERTYWPILCLAQIAGILAEPGRRPPDHRGKLPSGQVIADFEGPQLGSSRAYLHWYNDRSLTSSHEKFGLTIPAVGGYWTVPNVHDSDDYRVHLAVTNLDARPYLSDVVLKDDEGHELQAQVWLPPNGSRFVSLAELFQDAHGFLHGQPGVLYFGNNRQPAMYYYFVQNQRLGTWRAQHL